MALNISMFVIPLPIFLAALVLVVAAIIVLTFIEVRLGKKAKIKREYEETYYQRKLAATVALQADQNSFLISLDKVVREFFSEELELKSMGKYVQIIEELNKKQRTKEMTFCQKMQEALYSGKKLDKEFLYSLYSEMKNFVLIKEKKEIKEIKTVAVVTKVDEVSGGMNSNILKYMREGIKRGFEVPALRKKLIHSGFDEREIAKVEEFLRRELYEPKLQNLTEKRILTNFFNPPGRDLDIIKKSVEEKDDLGRAEIIEIVPYRKEEIQKGEVKYPEKEPESYKKIGSLDNLERVRKKIDSRKQGLIA